MALTRPMALPITAFDVSTSKTFYFTSSGGNQVTGNRLTIRKNSNNEIVYQEYIDTYAFSQTVPANYPTLENGEYYNFYFNTFNINGDMSENSNVVSFYCYSTPTITFTNIPYNNTIEQAYYTFNLTYNQSQGELLDTLVVRLYDANHNLYQESNILRSSYTPPINFEVQFSNLIDDETYFIKAFANTVNGTEILSEEIQLSVEYDYGGTFMFVNGENKCFEGCTLLENNMIAIDGQPSKVPPTYIDDTKIWLENNDFILFNSGFSFKSNKFVKMKWWSPMELGNTVVMSDKNNYGNRFEISLQRGIPEGESTPVDYIELKGFYNGEQYMMKRSNQLRMLNNLASVVSYIKIDDDNINIILARRNNLVTELSWNDDSNAQFGRMTDIVWEDEEPSSDDINVMEWNGVHNIEFNRLTDYYYDNEIPMDRFITGEEFYNAPESNFEITSIILLNSVIDHFYITKDMNFEFTQNIPTEWTNYTVVSANFNNNLMGGNISRMLDEIDSIKIKRRKSGEINWLTLLYKTVSTPEDINFYYRDYYAPSGYDYEYTVVPCYEGSELAYFTTKVHSHYDGCYVCDATKTMKLYSAVTYNGDSVILQNVLLQPYNKRYPTIVENPNVKYRTVSITGNIIGANNYNSDIDLNNRNKIVEQRNEWEEFLTNGYPKIIKDWNGNIVLGKVTVAPSYTFNILNGNAIPTITFTVTEQGQYDNQKDLYNNKLIEVNI